MHNWSGNYNNSSNPRAEKKKTSCGRPFAPELTVRAGGIDGKNSAVVPCCQTLGPPNESKSVLGHLDDESFEDVYFGENYNKLRSINLAIETAKVLVTNFSKYTYTIDENDLVVIKDNSIDSIVEESSFFDFGLF